MTPTAFKSRNKPKMSMIVKPGSSVTVHSMNKAGMRIENLTTESMKISIRSGVITILPMHEIVEMVEPKLEPKPVKNDLTTSHEQNPYTNPNA